MKTRKEFALDAVPNTGLQIYIFVNQIIKYCTQKMDEAASLAAAEVILMHYKRLFDFFKRKPNRFVQDDEKIYFYDIKKYTFKIYPAEIEINKKICAFVSSLGRQNIDYSDWNFYELFKYLKEAIYAFLNDEEIRLYFGEEIPEAPLENTLSG